MKNTFLAIVSVLLISVIGVQGYYTYLLSEKVDKLSSLKVNLLGFRGSQPDMPFPETQIPESDNYRDIESWDPFEELRSVHNKMNRVFGDSFSRFSVSPRFKELLNESYFSPNIDLKETKDQYVVQVDLPGVEQSSIVVDLKDKVLHIDAKTQKTSQVENNQTDKMLRNERFLGSFERTIALPKPVKSGKMKTNYKNGVLTIEIPKI